MGMMGWVGRKGARCALTPMGPMPGRMGVGGVLLVGGWEGRVAGGRGGERGGRDAATHGLGLRTRAPHPPTHTHRHAALSLTRAAAAVGDAEGLVEVEVAHVGADDAGGCQPHLGVHVGAIHVHLGAHGGGRVWVSDRVRWKAGWQGGKMEPGWGLGRRAGTASKQWAGDGEGRQAGRQAVGAVQATPCTHT